MKTFKQFHEQQLEEGPMWDAAKEALKSNAKYLPIAVPAPGGMPTLAAKTAYDFYSNYKKKRKKALAEEEAVEYDEKKHPRAPKGTSRGGQWVRKSIAKGLPKGIKRLLQARNKKWWKVTQDTGDEWNQAKSRQLALQYEKAKPKLEKLVNDIVSGKIAKVATKQSRWDDLTDAMQTKVEGAWKLDNYDYFYDEEKDNWYQEYGIRDAKYQIYHDDAEMDEWLKEICEEAVKEYEEDYEGEKIPYNPAQIYFATQLAIDETDYGNDAELSVKFGKIYLENPSDVDFDPKNQLDFPGIEPIDLSTHLTVKMRMFLRKKIVDAFNKKAEDALSYGNVEPPDYLKESVGEMLDDYWATMPDDGPGSKFEFALNKEYVTKIPENDEDTLDQLPGKYLPFGVITIFGDNETPVQNMKENYERTQALAHNLFRERAVEILKERGIIQEHPDEAQDISVLDPNKNVYDMYTNEVEIKKKIFDVDHALWHGWKGSSTSWEGLAIQVATSEELGGRFNKYKNIFTEKHIGGYKNVENFKKTLDSDFGYIGGYEGLKALMRAKWETTQFILDKAGKDEVSVYRSISSNQAKEGVELENVEMHGKIYHRIKNVKILRNGCASTTMLRSVANGWNHYSQVVLRIVAPRTAVLSLPCYGINVHHEKEIVLAGTAWKGWDAWEGPAPSFADVPLGKVGKETFNSNDEEQKDADMKAILAKLKKDLEDAGAIPTGKKLVWAKGAKKYLDNLEKYKVSPTFMQAAQLAAKLGSEDDNLENIETKVKEFLEKYYVATGSPPNVATSIAQYNTATILNNIQKVVNDEQKAAA